VDTNTLDSSRRSKDHSLTYHVALLTLGILSVILSAYVLSYAASTLVSEFGISDVVFGVVILSIATTIPEKFIAVVSGFRGQMGIMVANTVGSNIFLLSLCIGILWVITDGNYNEGSVKPAEIGVMLGSAVVMTLTVWFGAKWGPLDRCYNAIGVHRVLGLRVHGYSRGLRS
jgi:Ca2+/Na+ antiporter